MSVGLVCHLPIQWRAVKRVKCCNVLGTEAEYQPDVGSTKDNPHVALTGALWGAFLFWISMIFFLSNFERQLTQLNTVFCYINSIIMVCVVLHMIGFVITYIIKSSLFLSMMFTLKRCLHLVAYRRGPYYALCFFHIYKWYGLRFI